MADADHYVEAANGLEAAAKALRACGEEEAEETDSSDSSEPTEKKSANPIKDAGLARRAQMRKEKASSY
jgi:hypothetical protein